MPSTAIHDIVYDEAAATLAVTFISSGRRYRYAGVPLDEYQALRRAFSKGAWFNTHIRDRYPAELISDPAAPAPSAAPISATVTKL